ncbi:MAG: FHA domain-containing protein [Myxococcaceae bacterium]
MSGAAAAKLVCTAGPKEGAEYPLTGDEAVVGRASENAVSIPDTSVSRKHVLLRKLPAGWAASDMGSGNGTLVNGEPIAEETVLRNGDLITIGDTELSFADIENSTDRRPLPPRRSGSDQPAGRPRPPPRGTRAQRASQEVDPAAAAKKKKLFIYAGIGVAVVLVSIVGIKVYQQKQADKAGQDAARRQAGRAQLGAIFQEGKNLVREGKWAEAKQKFEEMIAIDPNYPTLPDYLERANKEIPNQEYLAAAEAALDKNQLGPAHVAIDKVGADTQQYQQLRSLKNKLDEKITSRLTEGRGLLDDNGVKDLAKMRQLKEITDDILVASKDHRDAAELKKQAEEAIAELTKVVVPAAPAGPKPWLDVAARFRDGDVSGAFSLANECAAKKHAQCKGLVKLISSFSEKYKRLEALSVKDLNELVELDVKITGGAESKNIKLVKTRLANLYYKSAAAAKAAGEWGRSVELARKVLKVDAGHTGAAAIINELKTKAKDLYLQAYALKETSPDEAVKLFKDVLMMTPKDDETHVKAEGWVDKLQR